MRTDLEGARLVERTWATVREMTDDRSLGALYTEAHSFELQKLGLTRIVDHVLVGLTRSRTNTFDALDEALRRDGVESPELGARGDSEPPCPSRVHVRREDMNFFMSLVADWPGPAE